MNLLGSSFGGSGLCVGGGWGVCIIVGSVVVRLAGGCGVCNIVGSVVVGLAGGCGLTGCTFCTKLSGQSRLLEAHFWLNRPCWKENVVSLGEPVMDLEMSEIIRYIKMHSDTLW